jgi:hypothetical protein
VNPIIFKRFSFVAFLAVFIALFMIGGIWFSSSWIPSPWFWLVDVGFLAASVLALIMWQIELAYAGITLEPEDMIDDDEAAEKEMKKPATIVKKQSVTPLPAKKATGTAKPAAKKAPAPATTTARPATSVQPAATATKIPAQGTSQKELVPAKPVAANPEQAKKEAAKLHDMFAASPVSPVSQAPIKQAASSVDEDKKFKVYKKIVFDMIDAYTEAGYTYFSFSKARKELGSTSDKDALKIKKFLINACELDILEKKGSKYFILRD